MSGDKTNFDIGSFAAVINSRLAAEARIERAIAFGWLCGGYAIALVLTGLGLLVAFYGYSFVNAIAPAAEISANAIADAFSRTELKTIVAGELSLSPDSELRLASGQTVKLNEGATVKLDPNSSVRIVGDLKLDIPQPSKQQLQLDTTSGSKELPFTRYTIFKSASYGEGEVVTGWNFDLSDTTRPTSQRCYYEKTLGKNVFATQTIAYDGSPRRPSALTKLSFDFDGALGNCIWFSGF
jgi:hypothetical protein